MGKRSNFQRNPRDFYPTPYKAVLPLVNHIRPCNFVEPCAGDGRLVKHLEMFGFKCVRASDIEPKGCGILTENALNIEGTELIITNPPWDRQVLHSLIEHFIHTGNCWLLLDSDWAFTKQSSEYMKHCAEIIPVGRVSWLENGVSGKDNAAWYFFQKDEVSYTKFYKRQVYAQD